MGQYDWKELYQMVERALATFYGADDATRRGALQARLDNLRRAEVIGVNPGKGQRNDYDRAQICKFLLALEFEEFGLAPAIIARLLTTCWETFSDIIERAVRTPRDDQDVVLWIYPNMMSARWRKYSEFAGIGDFHTRKGMV